MRALMVTILTLWAATCGQKGPLELPEQTSAPASAGVAGASMTEPRRVL